MEIMIAKYPIPKFSCEPNTDNRSNQKSPIHNNQTSVYWHEGTELSEKTVSSTLLTCQPRRLCQSSQTFT